MLAKESCSVEGCDSRSLKATTPPLCRKHVTDLDEWYEKYKAYSIHVANNGYPEHKSYLSQYLNYLMPDDVGEELYQAYRKKLDPSGNKSFMFSSVVLFIMTAAASGIIGNLSYKAVLRLLKYISPDKTDFSVDFKDIVSEDKYEILRIKYHSNHTPIDDYDIEFERRIARRYRNIKD